MAAKPARDSLQLSLRMDSSPDFLRNHVLRFIRYLTEPAVKSLYDGQLLLLLIIAQPPVLWSNLLQLYRGAQLDEDDLFVFAWLCFELVSLKDDEFDSFPEDISEALEQGPLKDAKNHRTRELTYRIKNAIALRSSIDQKNEYDAAGGRHDNDFANFREISIFPTSDEFHSNAPPFYRRAAEVAAVEPSQRARILIDNQFRLLREDMLAELRDDLKIATGQKRGKKAAKPFSGLSLVGIDTGDENRGRYCSILVGCRFGLELPKHLKNLDDRKSFLFDNKGIVRHQSFGVLYGEGHIIAFAFVYRDVNRLAQIPAVLTLQFTSSDAFGKAVLALKQSPDSLQFILVNTPVFAYQPVLECLQEIAELPLAHELLGLKGNDNSLNSTKIQSSCSMIVKRLEQSLATETKEFALGGKKLHLDDSQIKSLLHALQNPVSLIQGPPGESLYYTLETSTNLLTHASGTGKSFIGAIAARILLDEADKRLLILSYTNHALDQFLVDVMNIGISADSMVRLGSKFSAKTEHLSLEHQFAMSSQRRCLPHNSINNEMEKLTELRSQLDNAFNGFMEGSFTWMDIIRFLEFESPEFYEAFQLPTQSDNFQLSGKGGKIASPDYLVERWATGKNAGPLSHIISPGSRHIWQIPPVERSSQIWSWTQRMLGEHIESLRDLVERFDQAERRVMTLCNEARCTFLQTKRVIGCTTTGAAKYKSLIKAAKPDVVLVEEAGELLEAHVLTALHPATQKLILIGDHKQLRPKINNYALSVEKGAGFDLNRSLFERLIVQGYDHATLRKQHRMHPTISHFVKEMTYPDLLDDDKTLMRPSLIGIQGRVSFVNHENPEDFAYEIADRRDVGFTSSKKNQFEAEMVLKIVKYLAQQGYGTQDIVVLTPYLGQLRLLKDMLSEETDPLLNDLDSHELISAGLMTSAAGKVKPGSGQIKLSTIGMLPLSLLCDLSILTFSDNYQGEESDIVVVSLTRSNKTGDIGFMKAPERLNVLCSRARDCLIMLGNMDTFMASHQGKEIWLRFFGLLKEKGYLQDGVAVRCNQHPDKTALLSCPDDFNVKCPDGGCEETW